MPLKEGQITTIVLLIVFAILHLVGAVLTLVAGGVLTVTLDAASNDLTELMFAQLRAVEGGLYAVGGLNTIILVFECVLIKFANRLTTYIFIGSLAAVGVLISTLLSKIFLLLCLKCEVCGPNTHLQY